MSSTNGKEVLNVSIAEYLGSSLGARAKNKYKVMSSRTKAPLNVCRRMSVCLRDHPRHLL